MKILLTLTDKAWEHQLQVKQQLPGRYYVELCALDGRSLKPAVFTGTFPSLDIIAEHGQGLHLQLEAMLHQERTMRPATVAAVEAALLPIEHMTGHPGLDRHAE